MNDLPDRWFEDLEALIASASMVDLDAALPAVQCPVLVLAAECGRFIPATRSRRLAAAMALGEFDVISGSGHAAVIEAPDEVARRTRRFLARLTRAPDGVDA